jgi:hypothetical protein
MHTRHFLPALPVRGVSVTKAIPCLPRSPVCNPPGRESSKGTKAKDGFGPASPLRSEVLETLAEWT